MKRAVLGPSLVLAAACAAVGPDHQPPETRAAMPKTWREEDSGFFTGSSDPITWWRRLEDPVLEGLVERAVGGGLDVREALARVRESRALRGASNAEKYPVLDANALFVRRAESENTQFGSFVEDTNQFSAGFDAAWELDLWGRVRRLVEAADAGLQATVEDARDVAVSVAAETAITYVELRAFQLRVAIARTNVELQEETLALVRTRFEAGIVRERDVAQAATNVETTRSRVPALEVGARVAENRLAVLLGLPPGSLAGELAETKPIPVAPVGIAVGMPADLLRRRADVRSAERVLAAENARIGVAEADLYPRLTLAGSIGLAAEDAQDLAEGDSVFFGLGPTIRWNLFDAGRRRDLVEAQDARTEQARVRWERTVLRALEETENAMVEFAREHSRRNALGEAATQARLAVELARSQYAEGLSDFQTVLDSQRVLADLEDDLARSDAAITISLISLYKALGGGWELAEPPARVGWRAPGDRD
ncbi:MAG: efflux transporter outer membrane subunit [Planctomycetota bacterium]